MGPTPLGPCPSRSLEAVPTISVLYWRQSLLAQRVQHTPSRGRSHTQGMTLGSWPGQKVFPAPRAGSQRHRTGPCEPSILTVNHPPSGELPFGPTGPHCRVDLVSVSDIHESKRCAPNIHVQTTQAHAGREACACTDTQVQKPSPTAETPPLVLLRAVQGGDPDQGSGLWGTNCPLRDGDCSRDNDDM